jgi:acetylornithine/N-succinyldiaminopimelate aminotransferase
MGNLIENDKNYVLNVYNRVNLEVSKGEGVYLFDTDGNKYFDMYTGVSVNNLGHDPKILERIIEQGEAYIHLSNHFASLPVVNLAKKLVENSFASKVFFSNSGTESNEAAIKLAKKYGKRISESKYRILSANNSFHGRTFGGVSLTGKAKYQEPFLPLMPGVSHFDYNDIESLRNVVDGDVCAVFIEMIQGEGGVVEISNEFIAELVRLSNEYDFLIVVDEIQTGIGRTGLKFAYEKYDFTPDVVTLAKSLGGGLPIGAMLVNVNLENVFVPGEHGSTFGGNPLAAAAGNYVLDTIFEETFLDELGEKSLYLRGKLNELKSKYPDIINDVRGAGMMIGVDVGEYADAIKSAAFEKKLLINITSGTVIRLLPSLKITKEEIDEFLSLFESSLDIVK